MISGSEYTGLEKILMGKPGQQWTVCAPKSPGGKGSEPMEERFSKLVRLLNMQVNRQ